MSDKSLYEVKLARRTRRLSIRGIEYSINEWGDADRPLLFYLHGWADAGSTFQFVVDALQQEWRVVAPDWRGFGRSEHCGESYWFPDYVADLHELLQVFSPDAPADLVGHSMGANIASLYAGTMPDRVRRLVNLEGFGLTDSDPADAPLRYRQWIDANTERPVFVRYADFESLAKRIVRRSPSLGAGEALFVAQQWARETAGGDVELRADPAHKLPNPVLYRRAEAEACWRSISAEVLLVGGDASPFAEKFGKLDASVFPNARLTGIPDVGHMLHFEAPARLAEIIEQFLMKAL